MTAFWWRPVLTAGIPSCTRTKPWHPASDPGLLTQGPPPMTRIPWVLGIVLLASSLLGAGWYYSHAQNNSTGRVEPANDALPEKSLCRGIVDARTGVSRLHSTQIGKVAWGGE